MTEVGTGAAPKRGWGIDAVAFIAIVTCVGWIYGPSLSGSFVFDDGAYILSNRAVQNGLTLRSLRWAFGSPHLGFWHPVTWISHLLDVSLWGLNPFGHRLTNLTLHALNGILLYAALRVMTATPWTALAVALLFTVHPLRVESVAWVAERKDLLCALFWFAGLVAYGTYARRRTAWRYAAVYSSFVLSLLSKPTAVTFPLCLLLLDLWPLARLSLPNSRNRSELAATGRQARRLLMEKLPMLALVPVVSAVAHWAQVSYGAVSPAQQYPLWVRASNAVYSYGVYLWKTFVPMRLAAFYPHPGYFLAGWKVLFAAGALGLLTALSLRVARRAPYVPVGWLWFLGTLVPVIGLVQLGDMGMADRYTYIPHAGLLAALCFSARALSRRFAAGRVTVAAILVGAVGALAITARGQAGYWRDNETLFRHAVAVTEDNALARHNLGFALFEKGDLAGAELQVREALRLRPDFADAHNSLGQILAATGRTLEALSEFERAASLERRNPNFPYNIAVTLAEAGSRSEALPYFGKAIRLDPEFARAHFNRGVLLAELGQPDAAIAEFRKVVTLNPADREAARNIEILTAGQP